MPKLTFNNFLRGYGRPQYMTSHGTYSELIDKATDYLKEADYILIGAGAGLSSAAGAVYGGDWFKENFKEFRRKYGEDNPYMQDMYSAGFYPYPDEESFWGYWSKQCLLGGINLDVTPLYKKVLDIVKDKRYFVLSTNADGQFVKAGFNDAKIFCTQGDYFHIQCARACHNVIYEYSKGFKQMDEARRDCKIPKYMVPKCPVCGERMTMNLRCDDYFVEDENWHKAESNFSMFLNEAIKSRSKICLFELGVGYNTPSIIRYPFEQMAYNNSKISLVRLNCSEAMIPTDIKNAVGINNDMAISINDIEKKLNTKD